MGTPLIPTALASVLLLADGVEVVGPCLLFVVAPIVQAVICWKLVGAFDSIPPHYRFQEPGHVWLLMVPLFNLYWNFRVFPALAESFQVYFYSRGIADVEDCGERLARWYCYLAPTFIIPCLNLATGIAGLVVLILFLVEAGQLKNQIIATERATPP
jgi:hypothetical protein